MLAVSSPKLAAHEGGNTGAEADLLNKKKGLQGRGAQLRICVPFWTELAIPNFGGHT